jgi:hypothetical protein
MKKLRGITISIILAIAGVVTINLSLDPSLAAETGVSVTGIGIEVAKNSNRNDRTNSANHANKFADRTSGQLEPSELKEAADSANNSGQLTNSADSAESKEIVESERDRHAMPSNIPKPSSLFTDIPPSVYIRPRLIPIPELESGDELPGKSFQLNPATLGDRSPSPLVPSPANQNYSIAEPTRTRISDPTFSPVSSPTGR